MWHWLYDAEGWLSQAFGLVVRYPEWALVITFLAAIIEAVVILGTFLPATLVMMGVAGAAAAAGQPIIPFLAVAVAGAVIGEYLSYWIGYHYRFRIRQWWLLARRPQLMAGADRFFARYGSYSVALCRFIPVLRSTVPVAAGVAEMPRRQFLIANVASAFVWAPVHMCPAQWAGLSIDQLRTGHWERAAFLAAGVVAFGIAIWLVHRCLVPLMNAPRR